MKPRLTAKQPVSSAPESPNPRVRVHQLLRELAPLVLCNEAQTVMDGQRGIAWEVYLDVEVQGLRWIATRIAAQKGERHALLSPRELEIARLIAKGHCNKTVAAVLEISAWTVATYMRRVFAKLHVGTRSAMIARLVQEGLLCESPLLGRGSGDA